MANDSSERNEEPTAQRLKKAREEGQIARSVELSTAALLVTATLFFYLAGGYMFNRLAALFTSQLQFDRKVMDKAELLPGIFFQSVIDGYILILPIMVLLAFVAVVSTVLSGGLVFSFHRLGSVCNDIRCTCPNCAWEHQGPRPLFLPAGVLRRCLLLPVRVLKEQCLVCSCLSFWVNLWVGDLLDEMCGGERGVSSAFPCLSV